MRWTNIFITKCNISINVSFENIQNQALTQFIKELIYYIQYTKKLRPPCFWASRKKYFRKKKLSFPFT